MKHSYLHCTLPFVLSLFPASFFLAQAQPQAAVAVVPRRLSLPQAEELLLQRNQLIAASRYQLEVSQALRQIAGYKLNPVLHVGMEQVPVQSPLPGSAPRFFATNPDAGANPVYTGQVTKIFERGGKRELRVQQAEAVVNVSRAQILDTFRTQLYQLRQAFTGAMLAEANLRLVESIDAQYAQTERLTNVRVQAGDLAEVELFRARAGRLPYRQAVLDSQAAYEQAVRDILNLLNLRPEDAAFVPVSTQRVEGADAMPAVLANVPVQVIGQLATRAVTTSLAELRQMALDSRPDVAAARNNVRAAERAAGLARAQRSRDVAVGLEYQRVGEDNTLGVIAEIPLFVYNNQKTAIVQALAQQRAAEAQLRQAETQAITDVEKAYQAYLSAQRSLAIYNEGGLATTERVRSVMEYSYKRGEASLFELLDAQRIAGQSAVAANQVRAAHQLAFWQLEQAIGRPLP